MKRIHGSSRLLVALAFGVTVALTGGTAGAQEEQHRVFLGAQLMVTAEPDASGEVAVAVNALPLVLESSVSRWVGVRVTPVVNVKVGAGGGFAQRGASVSVPIYLSPGSPMQSWYVGPNAGLTAHKQDGGSDLTVGGEGGFRWKMGSAWSLNLAAQLGATHLWRPGERRWVNHFGVFPSIGRWLP